MNGFNRRQFIKTVGGAAAAVPAMGMAAQKSKSGTRQPNILFILTDNQNPNVLGHEGHPIVKTPNLDRLASGGTTFTNCYCGSPLCVPARASIMSGMFPSDVDSWCNATPFQGQVPTWGKSVCRQNMLDS
jgi:arylsulfatase A-like enzyme